jgi:hypothetical protein
LSTAAISTTSKSFVCWRNAGMSRSPRRLAS